MNQAKPTKRTGRKIPIGLEERIVELSHQNPEFGAKRLLPLLKCEDINVSTSSIYRILKRHGLQTRILRIAKMKEQCHAEDFSQNDAPPSTCNVPEPLAVTKSEPVVETLEKRAPSPRSLRDFTAAEKPSGWGRSFLYIMNLSLIALIGYLGFHAVQNLKPVGLISDAEASIQPNPIIAAVQPQSAPRPLSDYQKIWQRNLFNIQMQKAPTLDKDTALEDLVVVKADLGLKLLGTVVADNTPLSIAIIQNLKTAEQKIYHEEDKVGEVYIKKILRNKIILRIDNEDQLLTIEPKDFAKARGSASRQREEFAIFQNQPNPDINDSLDLKKPESTPPPSRTKSIRLERDDVESALADVDGLMEQLRIAPYQRKDQPSGFRISGIRRGSVLRKLGLRSRDIIKEVNGQVMTSPAQAVDFFRKLSEGGELKIKLKRRRRDRWIHLDIE